MSDSLKRSARGILVDWANRQDDWVRAITASVIASRQALGDEAQKAVKARFLAEKRLSGEEARSVPRLVDEAQNATGSTTFRLRGLRNCQNVNKLGERQEIEFGSRMTILYGENASGKTGYVRVLKRISGVRGAQPVLSDISTVGSKEPQAEIEYELDGQVHVTSWRNEAGIQPFNRVTVFDTPTANIHLTENLEYVFTPADLSLFELVHGAVTALRRDVLDEIEMRKPAAIDFLSEFNRGTECFALVETLGVSTSAERLDELSEVSDSDREYIRELKQRVDSLHPETSRATLRILSKQLSVLKRVIEIVRIWADFDHHGFAVKRSALDAAVDARASELSVIADDVDGQGLPAFQTFLEAAEAFLRDSGRSTFPKAGDKCLFCRQELSADALELLRRYRSLAEGASADVVSRLRTDLEVQYRAAGSVDSAGAIAALESLDGEALRVDSGLGQQLHQFLGKLQEPEVANSKPPSESLAVLVADAQNLLTELEALQARLNADQVSANSTNDEREALLAEAQKQLDEQADRLVLKRYRDPLRRSVEYAVWSEKASGHLRNFQGVLKSLTEASKQASEQALQRDFESRFKQECRALRAPTVEVQFPGRQGRTTRIKSLSQGYGLDVILSEGEQKVLALADFLSEGLLREGSAPIVFDDPVNSLDYRRLHEVVSRVVELSENHQVIVFTHNVWFASEILARFEKNPDVYRFFEIADLDGTKGVVSARPRPRTDSISHTKSDVDRLIEKAGAESGEDREIVIERAYDAIRNWCEVFVEQEMLCSVSERYSAHVGVTKLKNLQLARIGDATDEIMSIYQKSCRQLKSHSQPRETLNIRATLDELRQDWADALACRKKFLSK